MYRSMCPGYGGGMLSIATQDYTYPGARVKAGKTAAGVAALPGSESEVRRLTAAG